MTSPAPEPRDAHGGPRRGSSSDATSGTAAHDPRLELVLHDDLDEEHESDPELKRSMRAHSQRRGQRRRARLDRPIMALPLTPLIDVVFQLLVFFLLVTDFSGPEEVFRLDLPEPAVASGVEAPGGAGSDRDPFLLDRQPVRVLVTTTGPGEEDCQLEVVGVAEAIADFSRLEAILRGHLADPATRRGLYLPDHPVVLEPSPATTWEHSVGAFNAIVRAGYGNIVFKGIR